MIGVPPSTYASVGSLDPAISINTPTPVHAGPPPPVRLGEGQPRMDHHEKMRIRAAAFRATRPYPGPVGELLSRELLTWEEFGYRLGAARLIMQLVDHVPKTPLDPA